MLVVVTVLVLDVTVVVLTVVVLAVEVLVTVIVVLAVVVVVTVEVCTGLLKKSKLTCVGVVTQRPDPKIGRQVQLVVL